MLHPRLIERTPSGIKTTTHNSSYITARLYHALTAKGNNKPKIRLSGMEPDPDQAIEDEFEAVTHTC